VARKQDDSLAQQARGPRATNQSGDLAVRQLLAGASTRGRVAFAEEGRGVAHFSNGDEKKGKEKGARERKKKMPKILRARQPFDEKEERQVRRLAGSRHGPADWILRARIVTRSWDGQRVDAIASDLHCGAQTVRRCLHRFNEEV